MPGNNIEKKPSRGTWAFKVKREMGVFDEYEGNETTGHTNDRQQTTHLDPFKFLACN